jgi:hypothetical protein
VVIKTFLEAEFRGSTVREKVSGFISLIFSLTQVLKLSVKFFCENKVNDQDNKQEQAFTLWQSKANCKI